MTLAAVCAALAAWLLVPRSRARSRLPWLLPRSEGPVQARGPRDLTLPLGLFVGLGVAVTLRNAVGLVLAVAVVVAVPRLLRALAERDRREAPVDDAALALSLDMLAACLAGGAPPIAAVGAVAAATPGPVGASLQRVASGMAIGLPPDEAFLSLGDEGPAGVAARTLRRAMDGGTPVAKAMARVAEETRHASAMAAQTRARRLAVTAVAPLLLCFLPAFLLIGVVPALYGVFVEVFGQLG